MKLKHYYLLIKFEIQRLKLVGVINKNFFKSFGFSGVLLRFTGIPFDLREPYLINFIQI